jgi:Fe-S-cluster containining protein
MSYVEYVHILNCLLAQGGTDRLAALFSGLGVLEEEDKLLCPFINDHKEKEHCSIYTERPLICRVFGTSAAPCEEDIEYPAFSETLFYKAYDLLYYMEAGNFIGLPLEDGLALYEAPFDIWVIADSGRTAQLMEIFKIHGSMRAVLYDTKENRFFAISDGQRHYLE